MADGSLELLMVRSEPRIHPKRTFETSIVIHIPECWDLPVIGANHPNPGEGGIFLSDSIVESIQLATDEDFKAFILEQKQSLIDLKKNYQDYASQMKEWFQTGVITGYKWWENYRNKKELGSPPPLETVSPKGQRTLGMWGA